MSTKKILTTGKKLLPEMLTRPFTCDLNLTTPKRRTLIRLLVNFDPRCTFFLRNTYQTAPLRTCNVSIGSMCLATNTPKGSGIQKKNTRFRGTISRILDVPLTSYDC